MKIYTYSEARQKLAQFEESENEELVIRRREGDMFSIVPKPLRRRSPFDVPCLRKGISRKEILEAIRESREGLNSLLQRPA
ncbi:MAG: prevent-host-death protein [Chloroflexi bacterium]|nr:prevent-host-death protein [Chloroflexota bacterium]